MEREDEPGALAGPPGTAQAAFYLAEALRYRRALMAIEACDYRGNRPAEQTIAWRALNKGDAAAGLAAEP